MKSLSVTVAARIGKQLLRDRRFLVLAVGVPGLVVYLLRVFLDALPRSARVFADLDALGLLITGYIVHFTAYILCLVVVVRERREQTLARMFVNNFRPLQILLGYLGAYGGLATVQAAVVMGEVYLLFRLEHSTAAVLAIFAVYWLLAFISIALGLLISNAVRTEAQIFPVVPLFMLPSVLLSGLVIPVAQLPWTVRWISYLTPFSYAVDVLRPLAGSRSLDPSVLVGAGVLVLCGAALLALAALTIRERD